MLIDPARVNLHCGRMKISLSKLLTHPAALLSLALFLTACASVATRLPVVSQAALDAEKNTQHELALTQLENETQRLMNVAWPVIEKNSDLCGKIRPGIGVKTHSLRNYGKTLKDASTRILGAQEKPTILYVIPGSPADRAGLRKGDMLLNIQGDPANAASEKFWSQLKSGSIASINITRDGAQQAVQITANDICRYNVRLRSSIAINAYADGRNITVTSGMTTHAPLSPKLIMSVFITKCAQATPLIMSKISGVGFRRSIPEMSRGLNLIPPFQKISAQSLRRNNP